MKLNILIATTLSVFLTGFNSTVVAKDKFNNISNNNRSQILLTDLKQNIDRTIESSNRISRP